MAEALWFLARSPNLEESINPLRVTNQLFALAMVALLLKFRRSIVPPFVDVRANTFSIYLIHPVLLWCSVEALQAARAHFHGAAEISLRNPHHPIWASPWGSITLWTLLFVVVYAGCLTLSNLLLNSRHGGWLVAAATLCSRAQAFAAPGAGSSAGR